MAPIQRRVEGDTCGKCRKKFQPGDRISQAYLVVRTGVSPKNIMERGVELHDDFEFVHIDCARPGLDAGLVSV